MTPAARPEDQFLRDDLLTDTSDHVGHGGMNEPERSRAAWAIGFVLIGVSLEATSINVALPTIAAEFRASVADAMWVTKASLFAVLLVLLPLSSLGGRVGFRHVHRVGILLFCAGSAGCVFAPNLTILIAFRFVQGLGIAAILSVTSALIRHVFPEDRLARAISYNAMAIAVFGAAGPSLTAALIEFGSWRWLFWISIALCLISFSLGWRCLPDNARSGRFNAADASLYAVTLSLFFLTTEAVRLNWPLPFTTILFVSAGALGLWLVRRSLARPVPLLPVDLLTRSDFRLAVLTSITSFAANTLAFVVLPFYMIGALHRTTLEVGLLLTAWPSAIAVAAVVAGRIAGRIAMPLLAGAGLAILATGLAMTALLTAATPQAGLIAALAVCRFGFGIFQTPNNFMLSTAAPLHRAGAAAGMQALARNLGQAAGVAIAAGFFTWSDNPGAVALATASGIAACAAAISFGRAVVPHKSNARRN